MKNLSGLLVALAFAIGLAAGWSVNGYRLTSMHDNYIAEQQQQSAETIKALRVKEKEVRNELEETVALRAEQESEMVAELDSANDSAIRLRREIDRLHERIDGHSSPSDNEQSSESASRMLSELSSGADALAGIYAEQADALRLDLQMCQRVYNTVRDASKDEAQK